MCLHSLRLILKHVVDIYTMASFELELKENNTNLKDDNVEDEDGQLNISCISEII